MYNQINTLPNITLREGPQAWDIPKHVHNHNYTLMFLDYTVLFLGSNDPHQLEEAAGTVANMFIIYCRNDFVENESKVKRLNWKMWITKLKP